MNLTISGQLAAYYVVAPVTSHSLPVTMVLMYLHYFYWQFVAAPLWLVRLITTLERALVIFFSVLTLAATLFAPWHRDRVSIRRGSLSGIFIAVAWNFISRAIGFLVRAVMLLAWGGVSLVVAAGGGVLVIFWYLLPFIILVGAAAGIALLIRV